MISLCTFVKDEEIHLERMLLSVKDYVDEIIAVDTGSTDSTLDILKKYDARIYQVGFTDFGKIRTITAHLAREPWVLLLDGDETLTHPEQLRDLIMLAEEGDIDRYEAFAFARKKWNDLEMTDQTELEAYPDWQVRFYQNRIRYVWERPLHEYFHGGAVRHVETGPYINHFQIPVKTEKKWKERLDLYSSLAPMAKVTIEGGKPL